MKLYRGLKSSEFQLLTPKLAKEIQATWLKILNRRSKGDFRFPLKLNDEINRTEKLQRFERQHFTDNKAIALDYAQKSKGILVEIDVTTSEIQKHFELEFQNFGKRKKSFEIVYVVNSRMLTRHSKKWRLKVIDLS